MATPTEIMQEVAVEKHPLDSLSSAELEATVRILTAEKQLGDNFRFVSITLHEPPKKAMEAYQPGDSFERCAFAVMLDRITQTGYEAVVDLGTKTVQSFTALPAGIQPSIMLDEFSEVEAAVKRSPAFTAALAKRGVLDANLVMVEPWSAGLYGTELPDDQGRRLMRALCFVRSEPTERLRPAHRQHRDHRRCE
jgi:primary-amine oxidase